MKCKDCNANIDVHHNCIIGCDYEQLESDENGCFLSKAKIEDELLSMGEICFASLN